MGGIVLPDGYSQVSTTIYRNTSDLKMGADIVKLTVVDSRGNTNSTTLKVNVTGLYFQTYLNKIKIIRDDGNAKKAKLKATGKISDYEMSLTTPLVTLEYSVYSKTDVYRMTLLNSGTMSQSDITYNTTDGTFEVNGYINGDLGAEGFTQDTEFIVDLSCYGRLYQYSPENYNGILVDKGKILKDVCESGVAFGGLYDTSIGGAVQVNGDLFNNGKTIKNIGKIIHLYRTAVQSIPSQTATEIIFQSTSIDTSEGCLTKSGNKIKIGNGVSMICVKAQYRCWGSMDKYIYIRKNGSTFSAYSVPGNVGQVSIIDYIPVTSNDEIGIACYLNSADTIMGDGSADWDFFKVIVIA